MAGKSVCFRSKAEMEEKFAEIFKKDPAMVKETDFHELLLSFAGIPTNDRTIAFVLEELALVKLSKTNPVNLGAYLEALVDDRTTINMTKALLKDHFPQAIFA